MKATAIGIVIVLVIIVSPAFAADTKKPKTKFTSVYTDLAKSCEDKFDDSEGGQDIPVVCKGPGGYSVHVDFSACCEHVRVEGKKDIEVEFPVQRFVTAMKRKVEWRLADGKPFAVIFRINKYKGEISLHPEKAGEVLVIKGLAGFPNIDSEVDVKPDSSPNLEARRLADHGYTQQ